LKKFQGDDGWDFHASEHRHQNDQPIPELPEPGCGLRGGDFSFFRVHLFGVGGLIWRNKFISKKALRMEPIFHGGG
jgi:hypothetical protein